MARRKLTEIKVHVTSYGEGRNLCLRYRDPRTGKAIVKTAGTTNRKQAMKDAGKWEEELNNGTFKPASKTTWEEFRNRYETECVAVDMRDSTAVEVSAVFDAVERIVSPDLLTDVDDDAIKDLKRVLREEHVTRVEGDKTVEEVIRRTDSTIRKHLATLRAGLNWAKEEGILNELPKFKLPSLPENPSKGRALALEEFERIISKIPDERPADEVEMWERLLWGLWWSGLRLDEAIQLTWDDRNSPCIDLIGEDDSRINIPGDCQKNGKDSEGTLAPEFFTFLAETPEADRTGHVFSLPFRRKDTVSKVISDFGEAAGVKVSDGKRTGKVKFASAHDFRRSFGLRWALRVMPAVLQKLMRHASIDTTMKYYVSGGLSEMSKALWSVFRATEGKNLPMEQRGNSLGNSSPKRA